MDLKKSLTAALTVTALAASGAQALHCLPKPPAGFPRAALDWHTGWPPAAEGAAHAARIDLGRALFADPRLSGNGTQSCASCHEAQAHLAQTLPQSVGSTGRQLDSNAPTLFNSALKFRLEWRAGGPERLFEQHRRPLTGTAPVEMGAGPEQWAKLNRDPHLMRQLHAAQVPGSLQSGPATAFDLDIVTRLIAGYVATLRCATTFDRYLYEDRQDALGAAARRGLELFGSSRLQCARCHRGPLLGGGLRSAQAGFPAVEQARRHGGRTLLLVTPSLRGVAHTAPYYFDGSAATLTAVIDDYASGRIDDIEGFALSAAERADLLAFLQTL
jgi:cytochrome c peroxidase